MEMLVLDIMDSPPLRQPLLAGLHFGLPGVKKTVVLVGGFPQVHKRQDDLKKAFSEFKSRSSSKFTVRNMMRRAPSNRATTTLSVEDLWHHRSQQDFRGEYLGGKMLFCLMLSRRCWFCIEVGEVMTATLV